MTNYGEFKKKVIENLTALKNSTQAQTFLEEQADVNYCQVLFELLESSEASDSELHHVAVDSLEYYIKNKWMDLDQNHKEQTVKRLLLLFNSRDLPNPEKVIGLFSVILDCWNLVLKEMKGGLQNDANNRRLEELIKGMNLVGSEAWTGEEKNKHFQGLCERLKQQFAATSMTNYGEFKKKVIENLTALKKQNSTQAQTFLEEQADVNYCQVLFELLESSEASDSELHHVAVDSLEYYIKNKWMDLDQNHKEQTVKRLLLLFNSRDLPNPEKVIGLFSVILKDKDCWNLVLKEMKGGLQNDANNRRLEELIKGMNLVGSEAWTGEEKNKHFQGLCERLKQQFAATSMTNYGEFKKKVIENLTALKNSTQAQTFLEEQADVNYCQVLFELLESSEASDSELHHVAVDSLEYYIKNKWMDLDQNHKEQTVKRLLLLFNSRDLPNPEKVIGLFSVILKDKDCWNLVLKEMKGGLQNDANNRRLEELIKGMNLVGSEAWTGEEKNKHFQGLCERLKQQFAGSESLTEEEEELKNLQKRLNKLLEDELPSESPVEPSHPQTATSMTYDEFKGKVKEALFAQTQEQASPFLDSEEVQDDVNYCKVLFELLESSETPELHRVAVDSLEYYIKNKWMDLDQNHKKHIVKRLLLLFSSRDLPRPEKVIGLFSVIITDKDSWNLVLTEIEPRLQNDPNNGRLHKLNNSLRKGVNLEVSGSWTEEEKNKNLKELSKCLKELVAEACSDTYEDFLIKFEASLSTVAAAGSYSRPPGGTDMGEKMFHENTEVRLTHSLTFLETTKIAEGDRRYCKALIEILKSQQVHLHPLAFQYLEDYINTWTVNTLKNKKKTIVKKLLLLSINKDDFRAKVTHLFKVILKDKNTWPWFARELKSQLSKSKHQYNPGLLKWAKQSFGSMYHWDLDSSNDADALVIKNDLRSFIETTRKQFQRTCADLKTSSGFEESSSSLADIADTISAMSCCRQQLWLWITSAGSPPTWLPGIHDEQNEAMNIPMDLMRDCGDLLKAISEKDAAEKQLSLICQRLCRKAFAFMNIPVNQISSFMEDCGWLLEQNNLGLEVASRIIRRLLLDVISINLKNCPDSLLWKQYLHHYICYFGHKLEKEQPKQVIYLLNNCIDPVSAVMAGSYNEECMKALICTLKQIKRLQWTGVNLTDLISHLSAMIIKIFDDGERIIYKDKDGNLECTYVTDLCEALLLSIEIHGSHFEIDADAVQGLLKCFADSYDKEGSCIFAFMQRVMIACLERDPGNKLVPLKYLLQPKLWASTREYLTSRHMVSLIQQLYLERRLEEVDMNCLLGICRHLFVSNSTVRQGFQLLCSIVQHDDDDQFKLHLKWALILIWKKLQTDNIPTVIEGFQMFFNFCVRKYGAHHLDSTCNEIEAGLFLKMARKVVQEKKIPADSVDENYYYSGLLSIYKHVQEHAEYREIVDYISVAFNGLTSLTPYKLSQLPRAFTYRASVLGGLSDQKRSDILKEYNAEKSKYKKSTDPPTLELDSEPNSDEVKSFNAEVEMDSSWDNAFNEEKEVALKTTANVLQQVLRLLRENKAYEAYNLLMGLKPDRRIELMMTREISEHIIQLLNPENGIFRKMILTSNPLFFKDKAWIRHMVHMGFIESLFHLLTKTSEKRVQFLVLDHLAKIYSLGLLEEENPYHSRIMTLYGENPFLWDEGTFNNDPTIPSTESTEMKLLRAVFAVQRDLLRQI